LSQPTLDAIRKLAVSLNVSADMLLFGKDERGPGNELRFQFEAVSRFDSKDKKAARAVLDGLILRHQAKMLAGANAKQQLKREEQRRGRPSTPALSCLRSRTPAELLDSLPAGGSRGVQIASYIIGALSEAALRVAHLAHARLLASDNAALCKRRGPAPAAECLMKDKQRRARSRARRRA
jgi:hypothetical protein